MKGKQLSLRVGCLCALLLSTSSFATITIYDADTVGSEDTPAPIETVPLQHIEVTQVKLLPIMHLWGFGGKTLMGETQGMWPFSGDNMGDMFYGFGEAKGATQHNGWSAGGGVGYRHVIHDTYILGGYVLADYNNSPARNYFVVINPGIEAMGYTWDARINTYIPATTKSYWYGTDQWGDAIGHYEFYRATGHQIYDHKFNWLEETGPGADAEVGYEIPHLFGTKAYIGGYHFSLSKSGSVNGVEGRLTFPINNYISLEARFSHDGDQGGAMLGGVHVSLGGLNTTSKNAVGVSGRLLDPIVHNIATFSKGYSVPIHDKFIDTGKDELELDNVWFFDCYGSMPGSTYDGTAEHPYLQLTPTILSQLSQNKSSAMIYFAPGKYDLASNGFANGRISLPTGVSMMGRGKNWYLPASASDVKVYGGVDIGATAANNTLDSFTLFNSPKMPSQIAITVLNTGFITFSNLVIGDGTGGVNDFATGMQFTNAYQINLSGNTVYAAGTGISANSGSSVVMQGGNTIVANGRSSGAGIAVNLNYSYLTVSGTGNTFVADGIGADRGIYATNNSTVNLTQSTFTVGSSSAYTANGAAGIYFADKSVSSSNLQVANSTFNVYGSNAFGIRSAAGYSPSSYQSTLASGSGNIFVSSLDDDHKVGKN